MKTKRKRPNEELNFWQPATDMFSALVLILLLIILLLSLYLVNIDDDDQIDPDPGSSVSSNSYDGVGAVISRPTADIRTPMETTAAVRVPPRTAPPLQTCPAARMIMLPAAVAAEAAPEQGMARIRASSPLCSW